MLRSAFDLNDQPASFWGTLKRISARDEIRASTYVGSRIQYPQKE